MAEREPSNVDQWLKRETARIRKALESASRYFDSNEELTVNTLEAVYGQENSCRKEKGVRKGKYRCTEGHWVTIDDRPVFVCD